MAAKRKSANRKSSSRKRKVAAAPAMEVAPAMAPVVCGDNEKWVGLGLFFVGGVILLNSWASWVTWSVLVGAVLAVYGLYHYFRYG